MSKITPEQHARMTTIMIEAMGIALGRALPLIARHPPTDADATGFTLAQLDGLYRSMKAEGVPPHALMFLNAIYQGLNDSRTPGSGHPPSATGANPH